jgi:hypothetical protein
MLRYSRHAKRRMALYALSEEDVAYVVREGKREDFAQLGRMSFTSHLTARPKYPIRVVGLEQGKDILIITAYPLKKGRS